MKLQQLISTGFAVTALAAAAVPAVGFTLLGGVEPPAAAVSVPASWDAPPLFAELSVPVAFKGDVSELDSRERSAHRTPW